jgi:hypothetical protein
MKTMLRGEYHHQRQRRSSDSFARKIYLVEAS